MAASKNETDYWRKLSKEQQQWLRDFENGDLPEQTLEEKRKIRREKKRWANDNKRICFADLTEYQHIPDTQNLENCLIDKMDREKPIEAVPKKKPVRKRRNRQKCKNLGNKE